MSHGMQPPAKSAFSVSQTAASRSLNWLSASSSSKPSVNKKRGGQTSTVRAAGPTARPAHSSPHLIDADLDAVFPRVFLLGRRDPTNPLISCQWGNIGPEAPGRGVGFDRNPEVCRQLMDRAARDLLSRHNSDRACFAQRLGLGKPSRGARTIRQAKPGLACRVPLQR